MGHSTGAKSSPTGGGSAVLRLDSTAPEKRQCRTNPNNGGQIPGAVNLQRKWEEEEDGRHGCCVCVLFRRCTVAFVAATLGCLAG